MVRGKMMEEGRGWSDEEEGWLGRVSEANISAGVG